jgi:phosphate acetyltransferase
LVKRAMMDALLRLKKKIRRASARVVFPEGENDRIILAASRIVQEEIASPILLGQ